MNKKKVAILALTAAILASSGGAVGAVITAAPAEAATLTTSAPANLKAFTDAATLQSGITFTRPTRIVGTIKSYTVVLKQAGKADRLYTNYSGRMQFGAPLAGLSENTAYTVQVKANVVSRTGAKSTGAVASTTFKTGYSKSTVRPTAPASLRTTEATDKSFVARWTAPVGYVGTVTGYTVTVKQGTVALKTVSVSPSTLAYKVEALKAASAYTVEVKANFASANKLSKASSVASKVAAYTAKPVVNLKPVVTVSNVTSNSAVMEWSPIAGAKTYLTFVSEKGGQLVSRGEYSSSDTRAPIPNFLKPNTTYIADVQAIIPSADGKSWTAYSGVKEFTTASAPTSSLKPVVTISDITSTSAKANWTLSSAPNVSINMLFVTEKATMQGLGGTRWSSTTTSVGLDQLKPNTTYIVAVQAFLSTPDSAGNSSYVGTTEFTTKG
jgi:hypothetical protein